MSQAHIASSGPRRRGLVALLAALAVLTLARGATSQPLFDSDELLELRLTAPLGELAAAKEDEERGYRAGQLSYAAADGAPVMLDVDVRVRGNFRRRECRYPPLRIRFDKRQAAGTLFAGQRRLKLVSPCHRGARFEQYVIEEYLLYRTFALLGEHAFRARPLRVRFVDENGRGRTSFAFFIEDEKRMAQRYDLAVVDEEKVSYDRLQPDALTTFGLFQYLISSHDWSVVAGPPGSRCCHNARLLSSADGPDGGELIPVPYDFDFAGLINAPYTEPPPSLPITSVRQRFYRGRCVESEVWSATVARFQARRADIYALFAGFEPLSAKRKKRVKRYIDQFYDVLDDPQQTRRRLLDKCVD